MDYSKLSDAEIGDIISNAKELFEYDEREKQRVLIRKKTINYNAKAGDRVGCIDRHGYLMIRMKGKAYMAQRIVFGMHKGFIPEVVDHINRDVTDNRIHNLRAATKSENCCNAKLSKRNTSGIKGVSFSNGKWLAQIMKSRKRITLYYGDDRCEAVRIRLHAEKMLHGDFGLYHNSPPPEE